MSKSTGDAGERLPRNQVLTYGLCHGSLKESTKSYLTLHKHITESWGMKAVNEACTIYQGSGIDAAFLSPMCLMYQRWVLLMKLKMLLFA